MLHLVSLPAFQQEVIERIAAGDDVLLHQGAVWTAMSGHADNRKLLQLLARDCRIYVLQEMLVVNGIQSNQVLAGINVVNYSGWVELTVKNPVIQTWC